MLNQVNTSCFSAFMIISRPAVTCFHFRFRQSAYATEKGFFCFFFCITSSKQQDFDMWVAYICGYDFYFQ